MSDAPARVVFTTGFSRRYTGGVTEFAIEAKTLRGVLAQSVLIQIDVTLGHHSRCEVPGDVGASLGAQHAGQPRIAEET